MISDLKNDREFALKNGIRYLEILRSYYFCKRSSVKDETCEERDDAIYGKGSYNGITFRNFPNLYLNNSTFSNCTFEDCRTVSADGCTMLDCSFTRIEDDIDGNGTDFLRCTFSDSNPTEAVLYVDSDCKVDNCIFENVHAVGEDGQICRMIADREKDVRELTNCKFINCTVEMDYNSISSCSYKTAFGRERGVENLDDSCEILNS